MAEEEEQEKGLELVLDDPDVEFKDDIKMKCMEYISTSPELTSDILDQHVREIVETEVKDLEKRDGTILDVDEIINELSQMPIVTVMETVRGIKSGVDIMVQKSVREDLTDEESNKPAEDKVMKISGISSYLLTSIIALASTGLNTYVGRFVVRLGMVIANSGIKIAGSQLLSLPSFISRYFPSINSQPYISTAILLSTCIATLRNRGVIKSFIATLVPRVITATAPASIADQNTQGKEYAENLISKAQEFANPDKIKTVIEYTSGITQEGFMKLKEDIEKFDTDIIRKNFQSGAYTTGSSVADIIKYYGDDFKNFVDDVNNVLEFAVEHSDGVDAYYSAVYPTAFPSPTARYLNRPRTPRQAKLGPSSLARGKSAIGKTRAKSSKGSLAAAVQKQNQRAPPPPQGGGVNRRITKSSRKPRNKRKTIRKKVSKTRNRTLNRKSKKRSKRLRK